MPLAPFLARVRALTVISDEDVKALKNMRLEHRFMKAGSELVFIDDAPSRSFLLTEGFACMYKLTGPGRRQIVSFSISGDMPDLQSLHARRMDVSISALTDVNVSYVPHADVKELCRTRPDLNQAFWRMSLIEAGMAREWVVNIGQRDGKSRLAHLLCEMFARLQAVGLSNGAECHFPITQVELGDATGLTSVHVNRMMQSLRGDGLLTLDRRVLKIPDFPRLARFADFDAGYLQLRPFASSYQQ